MQNHKGARRHAKLSARLGAAALGTLAFWSPAVAQDAVDADGVELWNRGGCFACHGDLAGGGGDPANPSGPSLRRRLNHDLLIETISCGRPGSQMPSFLVGAYVETACYDVPVGTVPAEVPTLEVYSAEEVAALVAWLEENVIGKSRISRENCALFFDGNVDAPTCLQF